MSRRSLEQRVSTLERSVAQLVARNGNGMGRAKDWHRTIGVFTDDPAALAALEEAKKLRRKDRILTRPEGD